MPPKKQAAGGVLVDAQHRVLLREPAGHYGNYVWTFPKGRLDPGETPEQAALREVREETGYTAQILRKIPGHYAGDTTVTQYFLMSPVGEPGEFDRKETQAARWASFEEAERLIGMTGSVEGRGRDLEVLGVVMSLFKGLDH